MLHNMPEYEKAIERVEAWFDGCVIDRAPVRFSRHNIQYDTAEDLDGSRWQSLEDRWLDAEYQVDVFLRDIEGQTVRGESFPVYWPNLGPDIYAAFFGCPLTFGQVTSWSHPIIDSSFDERSMKEPAFDPDHRYLRKLSEMTALALEKCGGQALVGLTSWCPGIDCVAAWMGSENLCVNLMLEPERVQRLLDASVRPFRPLFDRFAAALLERDLPTVSWMGIPCRGTSHIAQADFSNMIAPTQFEEFCLPYLRREIAGMDRVIFHLDGKGVANHLDFLLDEPGITAIQWAQGVGEDQPILQWIPLIRRIQRAGKSVVVDLTPEELEPFMDEVPPEGVLLCIAAEEDDQSDILRRLRAWTKAGRCRPIFS